MYVYTEEVVVGAGKQVEFLHTYIHTYIHTEEAVVGAEEQGSKLNFFGKTKKAAMRGLDYDVHKVSSSNDNNSNNK